jgi:hypothetical protein
MYVEEKVQVGRQGHVWETGQKLPGEASENPKLYIALRGEELEFIECTLPFLGCLATSAGQFGGPADGYDFFPLEDQRDASLSMGRRKG